MFSVKEVGLFAEEVVLVALEAKARASEVLVCQVGGFASARCALDKSLHDEEWFVDFFHRALVFADGSGNGCDAHGSSVEFIDNGAQNFVVYFVETVCVDVECLECEV